jgi:hypothetical protein
VRRGNNSSKLAPTSPAAGAAGIAEGTAGIVAKHYSGFDCSHQKKVCTKNRNLERGAWALEWGGGGRAGQNEDVSAETCSVCCAVGVCVCVRVCVCVCIGSAMRTLIKRASETYLISYLHCALQYCSLFTLLLYCATQRSKQRMFLRVRPRSAPDPSLHNPRNSTTTTSPDYSHLQTPHHPYPTPTSHPTHHPRPLSPHPNSFPQPHPTPVLLSSSTILLLCCSPSLLLYCSPALLCCCSAVLLCFCSATLLIRCCALLLLCCCAPVLRCCSAVLPCC